MIAGGGTLGQGALSKIRTFEDRFYSAFVTEDEGAAPVAFSAPDLPSEPNSGRASSASYQPTPPPGARDSMPSPSAQRKLSDDERLALEARRSQSLLRKSWKQEKERLQMEEVARRREDNIRKKESLNEARRALEKRRVEERTKLIEGLKSYRSGVIASRDNEREMEMRQEEVDKVKKGVLYSVNSPHYMRGYEPPSGMNRLELRAEDPLPSRPHTQSTSGGDRKASLAERRGSGIEQHLPAHLTPAQLGGSEASDGGGGGRGSNPASPYPIGNGGYGGGGGSPMVGGSGRSGSTTPSLPSLTVQDAKKRLRKTQFYSLESPRSARGRRRDNDVEVMSERSVKEDGSTRAQQQSYAPLSEKVEAGAEHQARLAELAESKLLLRLAMESMKDFTLILQHVQSAHTTLKVISDNKQNKLYNKELEHRVRLHREKEEERARAKAAKNKKGVRLLGRKKSGEEAEVEVGDAKKGGKEGEGGKREGRGGADEEGSTKKGGMKNTDKFKPKPVLTPFDELEVHDHLIVEKENLKQDRHRILAEDIVEERKRRAGRGDFTPLWAGGGGEGEEREEGEEEGLDMEKMEVAKQLAQNNYHLSTPRIELGRLARAHKSSEQAHSVYAAVNELHSVVAALIERSLTHAREVPDDPFAEEEEEGADGEGGEGEEDGHNSTGSGEAGKEGVEIMGGMDMEAGREGTTARAVTRKGDSEKVVSNIFSFGR
mmetsp:Transcript_15884/g.40232  ORF Transcript_15884/g.40232 Transcript_15884/m.40232 type:complete len:716 (-) Transcript_15884:193-2340(-)|eukprot:CAMPEP_0113885860 /NCGR_PEP_ID=MMETSP0780_2-20120614/11181_1 /TAXON_ID=652834 /ORGANISM="Palpitomonas bilix" /LENGTH=715 /DNA_ID=CAMNT_0000873905 /DNA_START=292 /DNA_END=2439 /DNA_ORIENTATION=+ /assembly_acc=CAM_ASM_000599